MSFHGFWKGLMVLISEIIALILFFKAPGDLKSESIFFFALFGGATAFGMIVGGMLDGDI